VSDPVYAKRYADHVGFGEGDDGWEIVRTAPDGEDGGSCSEVIAQLSTELLADCLRSALDPKSAVKNRLRVKICDRLLEAYRRAPVVIAELCDTVIDPSGNLLGWIRDIHMSTPPHVTDDINRVLNGEPLDG